MHWHHCDAIVFGAKQDQMAAPLTVFDKALPLEETNEFFGCDGGQAWTDLGDLDHHLSHLRTWIRKRESSRLKRLQI